MLLDHTAEMSSSFCNNFLLQFVENPVLYLFGFNKSDVSHSLHMRCNGWLSKADLFCDERHADAILKQISIHLRSKVRYRIG